MKTSTQSPSRELSIRRSARLLGKHGLRRSPRLLGKSAMAVSKLVASRKIIAKVSVYPNTKNKNGQGEHVVKVHRAVSAKKKFMSNSKAKHRLNQIMRAWGMLTKAMSYTSIVGMRTKSFAMIGVDSRLVAGGFLTVLSNRYRKTIFIHNGFEDTDDPRFRLVCATFSGGNKLQADLAKSLPKEMEDKIYPIEVANRIREKLEELEKEEEKKKPEERVSVNNQVLVMGISEERLPQIYSVSSSSLVESSTTPTVEEIDGYCTTGSGKKWMDCFLEDKLKSPKKLPFQIKPGTAREYAMEALVKSAQNDVMTGGFLQTITLSKVGDEFRWRRHYKYQEDFDNEKMEHIDWTEELAPGFDNGLGSGGFP